jgi:hypothetical protein
MKSSDSLINKNNPWYIAMSNPEEHPVLHSFNQSFLGLSNPAPSGQSDGNENYSLAERAVSHLADKSNAAEARGDSFSWEDLDEKTQKALLNS